MNYLAQQQSLGFIALLFLFAFCFLGVHILRITQAVKKPPPSADKPEQKNKESEKKPTENNEPIYYIVEKRRKTKSTYGEPKRISFK